MISNLKLNLLFFSMDLVTLLAYPILFVYAKLHRYSRTKERAAQTRRWVAGPIIPGG